MDDDDEIQSNPTSPCSESPSSPPPSGRITVTVAAAPPHSNTLTLALPIQQQQQQQSQPQQQQRIGGPGGGREDCWSEGATGVLIDAWGERYLELSRGNLKQKHWKEVADVVSSREDYNKTPKTDIQCKNRIDTVKKKYKLEKAKISSGSGPSKWPFYEKLDELIGSTAKIAGTSAPVVPKGVPVGIPVGIRSVQFQKQQPQQQQKPKQFKRRAPVESESSPSEPDLSPDSTDSFPPETYVPKRPRVQPREMNLSEVRQAGAYLGGTEKAKEEDKVKDSSNWGNSVRELTRAILKFGEAYEHAESAKLQQLVEMEKQRMKFTKEMELQRMQFFMKTQLELSQLKRRRGGNSSSNHHRGNNSNTINGDNNSDNSSH